MSPPSARVPASRRLVARLRERATPCVVGVLAAAALLVVAPELPGILRVVLAGVLVGTALIPQVDVAGPALNRVADAHRDLRERQAAFLDAVAHELRTPVATIAVAADALRGVHGELPAAERAELVDILNRQVTRLRSRVEDVVALVDVVSPSDDELRATPVVGTLQTLVGEYLPGRQVRIDAEGSLLWDPVAVTRVLGPLLKNVAEHTPAHVAVVVAAGLHPAGHGALALSVHDGGAGLPTELGDRGTQGAEGVPGRFEQGAEARRRPDPGLGLGLSVVDAVARTHGGRLALGASPLGGVHALVLLRRGGVSSRGDVGREVLP